MWHMLKEEQKLKEPFFISVDETQGDFGICQGSQNPPLPPPQAHFLNTHAAIKKVISPACDVIAEEIRLNSVNRVYWTGL